MEPDQNKTSDTHYELIEICGETSSTLFGIFKPKWLRDSWSGFVWTCLHRSCSLRKATERDRNKERKKER